MKYEFPDTDALRLEYALKFKEQFLALNNLKVGDTITWNFDYQQLRSTDRRGGRQPYRFDKEGLGILKERDNGVLYVESLENYTFYEHKDNGLSYRQYKSWYVEIKKKSIKEFGRIVM